HIWDVFVQRKGLGDSYGILGNYRLCSTDKILSLNRIGPECTPQQEKRADKVEFSLASIRRCGHSQRYFYLEVGRSSKTGAGEIWMEVQDSIIAQNMYTTIMKSAKSKDDNLGPMIRIRSSSANAASKPTSMLFRRQTHTGQKPINCSPSSEDQSNNATNSESSSSATSINTVVLVGSPPKGSGANSSGAPNSKPRSVLVANPTLPACEENSLLGSCVNSSSNNATATSTIRTTSISFTTTIISVTTATSSTITASMANSAMHTTIPESYHTPTIVPFAGHAPTNSSAAAVCSTVASTSAAMFTCSHSSTSSLTSIGSCSPSDAYVPLVPGAGRSASPNQHPLSVVAAGGSGGREANVSGRGGLIGSPRLGVTAQSPSYRRMSLKKPTAKMEPVTSSPLLSSSQRTVCAISTVNTSTANTMATSMTAAMMMLPPSPSASMSKFHHYASTRQGGREVPCSGGGITFSNLLATITNSIVGSSGGGGGNGVGGSGEGGSASGGSGSSSGGSFSNFSSSKSSSCCSSTVSIQTIAIPPMGPPAPLPPPPLPPTPAASALRGVRRHTRSLSHHSANAIYLTSAKPLRRLRSTLRRHSVSERMIVTEKEHIQCNI
uniref:IRS-type PTB domain-containing protein n=1 Tax=Anopheles minimus TaxID=112268 RepID=A0A182VU75_9DIPT